MEGKAEDGYLVAVSPRSTPPSRRKTLTQLVQEERLGSLKYLITSSPPSSSRPPRAAAPTPGRGTLGTITTPARGPNRGTRHSRRSSRGNNEEEAAVDLVSRTRSLFSSAPSASADDRSRPQTSSVSGSGRRPPLGGNGKGKASYDDVYRLSIGTLERAPAVGSSTQQINGSSSAWAGQIGRQWSPGPDGSAQERGTGGGAAQQTREAGLVSAGGAPGSGRRSSGGGSSSRRASSGNGDSGAGVGTMSSGDDNNSFFGYGDEDEDDDSDDYDGALSRRRRLQHGCCVCVGVAWTAALFLCLASGGFTAWGGGEALEAAAACALLGTMVLAAMALCLGLPTWSRNEDTCTDSEWCCCWLWRRGGDVSDDEGGKLAYVGGVTYLAI